MRIYASKPDKTIVFMDKETVLPWMKEHANEYLDDCGEVNCTALAEAACAFFEAWGPEPTFDAPDEYFDWAVEAENWYLSNDEDEGYSGDEYDLHAVPRW